MKWCRKPEKRPKRHECHFPYIDVAVNNAFTKLNGVTVNFDKIRNAIENRHKIKLKIFHQFLQLGTFEAD